MNCKKCLVPSKHPVKFAGNPKGTILFLFDGPAPYENRLEMPKILAKICNSIKFPLDKVFIASAYRCYFEKDKFTAGQINTILENCRDSLDIVLKEVDPEIIICFGVLAFQAAYKKSSLKNARNQFFEKDGRHIACTFNPYAAKRDPSKLPLIHSDLSNINRFIDQKYVIQSDIIYKEVDSIRPILDGNCFKEGDFYLTGIDTEATGVHWYDPNYITISYQVSKNLTEGWTVILYEEVEKDTGDFNILINRGGTKATPIKVEIGVSKTNGFNRKIDELRELLSRKDFKKYFFNQKFEQHAFMNLGVTEFNNCCIDARVLAHTLDSNKYKNCSLDDLISEYTTYHSHKGEVTDVEKTDMLGLLKNNREKFIKYSSLDPVMTLLVTQELKKEIIKDQKSLNYFVKFTQPIENELLFEMERNGIRVDLTKIPAIRQKLKEEMEDILVEFKEKCPPDVYERHKDNFKLTRTIIMQESLFEWTDTKFRKNQTEAEHHSYGFNLEPVIISAKSGVPSTDKKQVLKTILDGKYPKKAKEFVQLYINWSERKQLLGNFIKNIEKYATKESRLHPSASLTFTSSGRTGFRNPNLQNQPKRGKLAKLIRQLFIADEGQSLIENDYKASELAWVAQVSGDEKMTRIFKEGKDPHKMVGLSMKHLPENYVFKTEEELKELRQHTKPINFGLIYLISPHSLVKYAKQEYGVIYTKKQAQEMYDKYFSEHRGIKNWHEKDLAFLRKNGYLRTIFGRKQSLPNVYSENDGTAAATERTGLNSMIQGPSSDMTLLSGHRIIKDERVNKDEFKIVLFIHDALIWSCADGKYDYYLKIVKEYMETVPDSEFGFKMKVPLTIEAEIGQTLAEMKNYEI
jgi:DNA polymerase I-like protein with 3'-5' exonuclease and polymerase domains/uracil-DNA glycosylase